MKCSRISPQFSGIFPAGLRAWGNETFAEALDGTLSEITFGNFEVIFGIGGS